MGMSGSERQQFTLLKDLLWSDVDPIIKGTTPSPRGAGCVFGVDVTSAWLKRLNLPYMVRSHYCVPDGIDVLTAEDGTACYTVFSCSNYVRSENRGGVVSFTKQEGG